RGMWASEQPPSRLAIVEPSANESISDDAGQTSQRADPGPDKVGTQLLRLKPTARLLLLLFGSRLIQRSAPLNLQGPLGLRARRERPRSRAAESQDELAPSHSMTSSARAGDVGPARKKRAARGWRTNMRRLARRSHLHHQCRSNSRDCGCVLTCW